MSLPFNVESKADERGKPSFPLRLGRLSCSTVALLWFAGHADLFGPGPTEVPSWNSHWRKDLNYPPTNGVGGVRSVVALWDDSDCPTIADPPMCPDCHSASSHG